jgi:copper chaperone CopZ
MKKLMSAVAILTLGFMLSTASFAGEKNSKVVKIKGMTCTACESKVTETLLKIDGVKSAEVSHKTGEATIVFASDKVDLKKIQTAVTKAGFQPLSYDGKSACEAGVCDCCSTDGDAKAEMKKAAKKGNQKKS